MLLAELIREKTKKHGPVSFRDFMEMSLYHPGSGYYSSDRERIGRSGDFYTSPHLTVLFGEMVARQLEEMWHLSGKKEFTVVEYGAGTGALCRDILRALRSNREFYDRLDYCIIEKSAAMREKEKSILPEKVRWLESIRELTPFTGCILSNELLDNFSVHQVVMEAELMEIFVDYKDGFSELLRPADPALKDYLEQLAVELPRGYRTEINLEAIAWIREVSAGLKKGFVLTIDYGYPSSGLYSEGRHSGTLVCYHKHQVGYSPYSHIGEQDITAHVNFSALHHWGLRSGLEYCGFTNQAHFLRGLGLAAHIREMEESSQAGPVSEKEKAFLMQTLLLDMGARFKILIQQKGMHRPYLSGLRFSQQLV
jgi:SAM-dependent MidA family methyltransferase